MILHELATNAAKYGALGNPEGKLSICWTVSDVLDLAGRRRAAYPLQDRFGRHVSQADVEEYPLVAMR